MARPKSQVPLLERIYARTKVDPVSGCRLWQLSVESGPSGGYGKMRADGRSIRVHREVWLLLKGPIPVGLNVLHRCDVPRCCEISHLWLGTRRDNTDDMMRKGRQRVPRGVDATSVKLTEAQVREVRVAGGLQREIAAAYGISQMQVSRIKRGVRWRHLFEETSDG